MPTNKVEASNSPNDSASDKITEAETREQKKARRAQIFARGVLGDRLHVDLPPELYGEWVFNDKTQVHTKEALGFRIDTEYARSRALHDKGDSASYVGDVVFMVCDREDKEIIDELRRERYAQVHNPRSGKQKEERDFISLNDPESKATADSKIHKVRPADITDAIKAASGQS